MVRVFLTDGVVCCLRQALKQELTYAMHLNVPAIQIELKGLNCVNLARIVSEHLLQGFSHLVCCCVYDLNDSLLLVVSLSTT